MKKDDGRKTNWREIKSRECLQYSVGGRVVGVLCSGPGVAAEKRRLSGLGFVEEEQAEPGNLIKYEAKTFLPRHVVERFRREYLKTLPCSNQTEIEWKKK